MAKNKINQKQLIRLVRRHLNGRYGQNIILCCVKIFSNNYGYSEKFCLAQNYILSHLAPSATVEQVYL